MLSARLNRRRWIAAALGVFRSIPSWWLALPQDHFASSNQLLIEPDSIAVGRRLAAGARRDSLRRRIPAGAWKTFEENGQRFGSNSTLSCPSVAIHDI